MALICEGCRVEIGEKRYLTCSSCRLCYDLDCVRVPVKLFDNVMSPERKRNWKCPQCRSKEPKGNNANTPVRMNLQQNEFSSTYADEPAIADNSNVTIRKRPVPQNKPESLSDSDSTLSPQGHTFRQESLQGSKYSYTLTPSSEDKQPDDQISLTKFRLMMEENNKHLVSILQTSIQTQMQIAISDIKSNFELNFKKISTEQTELKQNIIDINCKIETLNQKCYALQTENETLRTQIQELNKITSNEKTMNSSEKVLVLHGLAENYWESENDIIEKISNICYDLLYFNVAGYIDTISFIGKKGRTRPVKIEFICKRVKKYILENSETFKEAGLSVTEFLSPADLKKKQELRRILQKARREGCHATIRNDRLFINGKPYIEETGSTHVMKQPAEDTVTCSQVHKMNDRQKVPELQSLQTIPTHSSAPLASTSSTTTQPPNEDATRKTFFRA
ncbi:uncharacterized protein LOC125233804 [Leguminivora glycinivorella]|uniref:uncharacterized protein LOC125233804 n=1 Tax=Leguminivora glycinivorella TaxID=1035111 RepID=UPI00200DAD9F|nr:uncharacterized protein LOC125233804 [Leguminivora glycinivorella]